MTFKPLADDSSVAIVTARDRTLEVSNDLDGITISGDVKLYADAHGRMAAAKLIEILQGLVDAGDVAELPQQSKQSKPNPFG